MNEPTPREMEILKILWEQGASSVRAVHQRMAAREPDLAYNTVQTFLRIMEDKGLVSHSLEGRSFIYTAQFTRDQSARRFVDRVFDGLASQLVVSLLQGEQLSSEELERIQALINQARKQREQ